MTDSSNAELIARLRWAAVDGLYLSVREACTEAADALAAAEAEIARIHNALSGRDDLSAQEELALAIAEWSVYGKQLHDASVKAEAALAQARKDAIEECANIADGFRCGGCGMDGKAAAAIRELITKEKS